jgi:hypothetical protein
VLFVAESHRGSRQHARPERPHRTQARQKAPGSRGRTPRERGERRTNGCADASTRGAVHAAQACANDHDAPKRSDAILMMALVYKIRVTNQSESGCCGPVALTLRKDKPEFQQSWNALEGVGEAGRTALNLDVSHQR